MPRLTDTDYLRNRHRVLLLWKYQSGVFGWLSSSEQMAIHGFYATTKEFSDVEALEHRHRMAKERPSLPQQAGKAYVRLVEEAQAFAHRRMHPAPKEVRVGGRQHRVVSVRAVRRPEPDIPRLARALLELAKQLQAEEAAKREPGSVKDSLI